MSKTEEKKRDEIKDRSNEFGRKQLNHWSINDLMEAHQDRKYLLFMGAPTPFNQLDEAQAERLALLIEEASEVIHMACKVLRHGYRSINPDSTSAHNNRHLLAREVGDLKYAISLLLNNADISKAVVDNACISAAARKHKYLHHQGDEK